ncbi:MAG: uracil-DNA glycosylase [Thermanaeromonas sp.]|uniref:uracil-DNA glycosylase n=1 Tax=Thermanaeromonas sp. TaxID=2003697 RepID=UPI00243747A1|nr:uracil-DNA glycosylase [Thermanaeromonas sp.]MCG0278759.1 uracil-DNA glycosylase [Thermanaeromonas sp.]
MNWEELAQKVKSCRACNLHRRAKQPVLGEGNPKALLMLVGEAPGAREDELGRPFVGAAGELLNRILEAAGFKREDVYITNVVKCRPPGNRFPTPDEVRACRPYLENQIKLVNPKIVVCLGALATQALIAPGARITRLRGQWIQKDGIFYLPTFHPAALLRDENKKRPVWEDFKRVRALYHELSTVQLSLNFIS